MYLKLCKLASFKLFFSLTGLGDHQAGANQHRHLPGSQYEPCAAHWIPAEEEAARAEERRWFEEWIGTLKLLKPQTAILLWSGPVSGNEKCVRVRLIIWCCLSFTSVPSVNVCDCVKQPWCVCLEWNDKRRRRTFILFVADTGEKKTAKMRNC